MTKEQFEQGTGKLQKRDLGTTFFVWDGDVLLQEITGSAKAEGKVDTTTYLYEPDSFVPLVWMASQYAEEIMYAAPCTCRMWWIGIGCLANTARLRM